MTQSTASLLWTVAVVWGARQIYQRLLHARALRRKILFRAGTRHVRAWMLYPPYFALLVLAGAALVSTDPGKAQQIGLSTVLLGSLLVLVAMFYIRRSYTEELEVREGYRPITGGVYRLLRHPMRCGVLLEALGLAIISGTAWASGLALLMTALVVIRNRDEDAMLASFQRRSACKNATV